MHKSFMSLEAEEVLNIKLSIRLEEDVLAWAFEKNGFYQSLQRTGFSKRTEWQRRWLLQVK